MAERRAPTRIATAIAIAGIVVLTILIARGWSYGYLLDQGYAIASVAWGQVLVADIYTGLVLFAAWIGWREGPGPAAVAWIVALLVIGNLVACLYVLRAVAQARGDHRRFWYGRRAEVESGAK